MANKHEEFQKLLLMNELAEAKMFDSLSKVISESLWEVASDEWKQKQKAKMENNKGV